MNKSTFMARNDLKSDIVAVDKPLEDNLNSKVLNEC